MGRNTLTSMTPAEKLATLKEHESVKLTRKGRGRKTKHVTDEYRENFDKIKWEVKPNGN